MKFDSASFIMTSWEDRLQLCVSTLKLLPPGLANAGS